MTTVRHAPSQPTASTGGAGLLTALVLAVAGYQINATMLAPALPDVIDRLHTTSGTAGLAQTLFFLFAAIGQVTIARISDYAGRRLMLLVTLFVLMAGEVLCTVAPTIGVFVVGRMLQGVSAAAFALAYLILHEALSPRQFGRALGIVTAVNGGIAGVDAVIGGVVADTIGFRGVFAISLSLTAVATTAVFLRVPATPVATTGRMDWRGALLLGIGLTGVLLGLNLGGRWGWTSPTILALMLTGMFGLVAFAWAQKHSDNAIIDTAVLASRRVWPLLLATISTLAGVFGMLNFTVPLLTQTGAGYGMSATTSALLFLTPASALGLVAAPIAGYFAPRIGWRRSLLLGTIGTVLAFVPLIAVPRSFWIVVIALAVLGITYTGYSLTTLTGLAVEHSPADKPGSLPGLNGACFGIGASLGIAVASSVVSAVTGGGPTTFAALHAGLWVSAGFVLVALLATLLIETTPITTKNPEK